MKQKKGLVYVFEGDGKGKTSAALGVAVRMLLLGKKVIWISWFKSLKWPISESHLIEVFPETLKMFWTGEGFYIKTANTKSLAIGGEFGDQNEKEETSLRSGTVGNKGFGFLSSVIYLNNWYS